MSDFASRSHCSKGSWHLKWTASAKAGCSDIIVAEQATAGGSTKVLRMSHSRLVLAI